MAPTNPIVKILWLYTSPETVVVWAAIPAAIASVWHAVTVNVELQLLPPSLAVATPSDKRIILLDVAQSKVPVVVNKLSAAIIAPSVFV